jgi:hypothetical protein
MFLILFIVIVVGGLVCSLGLMAAIYLCDLIEKSILRRRINSSERKETWGPVHLLREPVRVLHRYAYEKAGPIPRRRENG